MEAIRCAYADVEGDNDSFTIRGEWVAPGYATIAGSYSLAAFGALVAAFPNDSTAARSMNH